MSDAAIRPLTMPKWGLSMTKGKVVGWLIEEGTEIAPGLEIVDVETEKILSSVEGTTSGVLRRKIAHEGDVVQVGGLLGVIATPCVTDRQIDQYIEDFQASYTPENVEEEDGGPVFQTADVDGFRINYLRRGEESKSAILLHGFGGDLNTWMFNQEALAARHSVYALDLPGHGRSSKQVREGSVAEFVKVLEGFMDSIGASRVHLVGHSMGGAIASMFALNNPEHCLSLTLIASAGLGFEINGAYIEGFVSARRRNEIRPQLENLFADSKLITRQLVDDMLKYKRLDGVESALRTIAGQFCSADRQLVIMREQIADLRIPILVLWGSEDKILPVSHSLNLPTHIRAEIFEGSGHMVHMEASSRLNKLISSFWESYSS